MSVIDVDDSSLNERVSGLLMPSGPYAVIDFLDESDVRYCLQAVLYHLNRVIDRYVANCQLFENDDRLRSSLRGNVNDSRLFFEVDALLSCSRRVYDAVRKVLWKRYMRGQQGRWRSIDGALKSDQVPERFSKLLKQSWNTVGEKLADYRDCVAHYEPLTNGSETCWMEPIDGRWGMTVKLPANPRSGRRVFDFESGPDALEYCSGLARHLVGLAEQLAQQEAVMSALLQPGADSQ